MAPKNNMTSDIERRAGIAQAEQANAPIFEWNFAFASAERSKPLNPLEQGIIDTHSPTGEYPNGIPKEVETSALAYTRLKRTSEKTVDRAIALSDFSGNTPFGDLLREKVVTPQRDQKLAEVKASKTNATEVESAMTRYDRRREKNRTDEMNSLKQQYGKSFEESQREHTKAAAKAAKSVGRAATQGLVTPIEEDGVIRTAPIEVVSDRSTDISAANAEAASITSGEAMEGVIPPIEAVMSLQESSSERQERIEEAASEAAPIKPIKPEVSEAPEKKKRGFLSKIGDVAMMGAVKLSTRRAIKRSERAQMSEEERKSSRKKKAAIVVGGLLVGAAAVVVANKLGHDFGLSGLIGNGHDHISNNTDIHTQIGNHADKAGHVTNPFESSIFPTEHADKVNTGGAHSVVITGGHEQHVATGAQQVHEQTNTATTAAHTATGAGQEKVNTVASHAHMITLHEGQTPSDIAASYANHAFPNATPAQTDALISNGWSHLIYSNGFTGADTHNIPANTNFDTSSMVKHMNALAGQMGLRG